MVRAISGRCRADPCRICRIVLRRRLVCSLRASLRRFRWLCRRRKGGSRLHRDLSEELRELRLHEQPTRLIVLRFCRIQPHCCQQCVDLLARELFRGRHESAENSRRRRKLEVGIKPPSPTSLRGEGYGGSRGFGGQGSQCLRGRWSNFCRRCKLRSATASALFNLRRYLFGRCRFGAADNRVRRSGTICSRSLPA